MKYEWENLFYACVHCNKIKGSSYGNIIDCTKEDSGKYITMRFNSYPENYVEASDRLNSVENKETRELLDKVYNGAGTPISEYEAKNLKKRISKELEEFIECVENYQDERDPKLRAVYWNDIKEIQKAPNTLKTGSSTSLTKKEERINIVLKLCRSKGFIVRSDVEMALGVSQSMAILLLRELTDDGILVKRGKTKNLRYYEYK